MYINVTENTVTDKNVYTNKEYSVGNEQFHVLCWKCFCDCDDLTCYIYFQYDHGYDASDIDTLCKDTITYVHCFCNLHLYFTIKTVPVFIFQCSVIITREVVRVTQAC